MAVTAASTSASINPNQVAAPATPDNVPATPDNVPATPDNVPPQPTSLGGALPGNGPALPNVVTPIPSFADWKNGPTDPTGRATPGGVGFSAQELADNANLDWQNYVKFIAMLQSDGPNNSSIMPTMATPTSLQGTNMDGGTPTSSPALPTATTGNPTSVAPPNLGVTPGGAGSGSLTQGAPLPNITTLQQQATAAPQYYTDYLNQLSSQGAAAAQGAQYVGAQPLQTQAFNQVAQNVGNYQPALNTATGALNQALEQNAVGAATPGITAGMNLSPADAAAQNINASTNLSPLQAASQNLTQASGLSGASAAQPYLNQGANAQILNAAQPYLNAAAVPTSQTVQNYMSPYTQNVVDQIGILGQQNIAQNVAPQAAAGLIGAGQFGSRQGASALAQSLANAGQNITAQQAQALQTGYGQALTAANQQAQLYGQLGQTAGNLAQNQASNQLAAGQTAGTLTGQQQANLANIGQTQGTLTNQQAQNLLAAGQVQGTLTQNQAQNLITGGQNLGSLTAQQMQNLMQGATQGQNLASSTQNLGLADVNALGTLGSQQQTIAQNAQLFPMQQLTSESGLLRGYNVPTSVSSSTTGPGQAGQYQASPLAQIAGLGTLAAGISNTNLGQQLFGTLGSATNPAGTTGLIGSGLSGLSSLFSSNPTSTPLTPDSPNVTTNTDGFFNQGPDNPYG